MVVAHVIIVTASVRKFGFGTLDSYFGLRLWTQDFRLRTWDFGLRLVNNKSRCCSIIRITHYETTHVLHLLKYRIALDKSILKTGPITLEFT